MSYGYNVCVCLMVLMYVVCLMVLKLVTILRVINIAFYEQSGKQKKTGKQKNKKIKKN